MAAPFFTNPQTLLADLATLGYPDVNDKSVLTNGEARLAVLAWLAQQADPTFIPSTPENLAAFWDRLGVHSTAPNNAGYRIPFTAPADRARDKNAANCFLRAAVDLVFAFRARRVEDPASGNWINNFDETGEGDSPLSNFDCESLQQIDMLINQRHMLFPNTTKLFQANPTKKRPLQRRQVNTNRKVNSVPRMRKMDKADKDSVPSREYVLDRLRQVQRRAHELETELTNRRTEIGNLRSPPARDDIAGLDNTMITRLADNAKALCDVVERFHSIATEGLAERERQTSVAKRDQQMEATLSGLCKECIAFQKDIQHTFDSTRRVKTAVEELSRSRYLLESLPSSAGVREVERHRQRTEEHF